MTGVTIVICCYNSSERLPKTLEYIAKQKVRELLLWEVIIVDNNSSDDTNGVALKEWQRFKTNASFSIIVESRAGLSFAREAGVERAKFEYVIFCDDDNWLCDTYLQTAFDIMEQNPRIGALGGQSDSYSDVPFPDWWNEYKSGYAVGKQAPVERDVSDTKYLWGAGLVTRKALLDKVFSKKTPFLLSDRKGKALVSGGDTEICHRILLLGYNLYYSEKLFFTHHITEERLTIGYRTKLHEGFDKAFPVLMTYIFVIDLVANPFPQRVKIFLKTIIKVFLMPLGFFKGQKKHVSDTLSVLLRQPALSKDDNIRSIIRFLKEQ